MTNGRKEAVGALLGLLVAGGVCAQPTTLDDYDVVIAGGSTAALAAAFTAAEEGARTALVEPTDWIGGQLTASGVPAVDEAWHKIVSPGEGDPDPGRVLLDVGRIARDPRNQSPFFRDALARVGNPGRGWVSRFCFEPRRILDQALEPRARELADRLTIYRNTVVKRVETDGRRILGLTAIQRTPRDGIAAGGYDRPPSSDLPDWYSETPSPRFDKRLLKFRSHANGRTVFIDATEWGEVLALSGAPYLQGVEAVDGEPGGDDRCGQAITYGFVQRWHAEPQTGRPNLETVANLGFGRYRDKPDAWRLVWTYRRLLAASSDGLGDEPGPGDLSLQNWEYDAESGQSGNDYPGGYLLLSRAETGRQARGDWRGGVDLAVMHAAERQAFAWHDWFRRAAPAGVDPDCFTIAADVLGTGHGLSKVPYVRDTRRSVGLSGFLLTLADLTGPAEQRTGTVFADRIALGAYAVDIHPLAGCRYPDGVERLHPTLPFYLPYRSLTNERFDNLLVAGKTMAQTFLANAATRLHPIEWSSGAAAGGAAAHLAATGKTTREGHESIRDIQAVVRRHTPLEWTIND